MRNSTDTRRVAVWLVGAMFSACACLFLACSCLGVRGWAATGRDTAPPATDPRPESNTAPTSLNLDVGTQERRDIEQKIAWAQHIAMVTMDDGKVNAKSPHAIGAQKSARLRRAVEGPKSSHPLEKGAATIDVYGKGVAILLRRHS
jgi:hypothetical protein